MEDDFILNTQPFDWCLHFMMDRVYNYTLQLDLNLAKQVNHCVINILLKDMTYLVLQFSVHFFCENMPASNNFQCCCLDKVTSIFIPVRESLPWASHFWWSKNWQVAANCWMIFLFLTRVREFITKFLECNSNLAETVAGKLSLVGNIANETILRIIKLKIRLGVLRL